MKPLHLLFLIAIIFTFSCTSYKQVPYFQDVIRDSTLNEKIINYSPVTIAPGDLLGINVTSLNHEADLIINYNLVAQPRVLDRLDQTDVVGYLIDKDGNINLPLLGLLKVSGYTTKETAAVLESKLQSYLSKPIVNVRILNFKISILGDVKLPGNYNIQDEKVTITQALGLAGDLNTTALRKNVLLIREKDGNRKYINVDLTSKDIITSPYYYLRNNDVLYVQPNEAKVQNDAGSLQKIGFLFSAFSTIIYAVTLYISRN